MRVLISIMFWTFVVIPSAPLAAQPGDTTGSPTTAATQPTAGQIRRGYLLAPQVFRSATARVMPSVVTIETFGGVIPSAPIGRPPHARPGPDRRGPGNRRKPSAAFKPGEGPTTGLVISADGYILTSAFNFVKQPPVITVVLRDGRRRVAKIVGRDMTRQLIMLKIDNVADLPVPGFLSRDQVRVGQWSIAVGLGYGGEEPAMSVGIISAARRISGRAIQTDANISPANYGGPLVDIHGRVIGLCMPLTPRASDPTAGARWYDSGIGFVVPIDPTGRLIEQMKQGKTIHRGQLGIVLVRRQVNGAVAILRVAPKSPAAEAGLAQGDLIVKIDDLPITGPGDMAMAMGRYAAGDSIQITIQRKGRTLVKQVTLGKGPYSIQGKPASETATTATKPSTDGQ